MTHRRNSCLFLEKLLEHLFEETLYLYLRRIHRKKSEVIHQKKIQKKNTRAIFWRNPWSNCRKIFRAVLGEILEWLIEGILDRLPSEIPGSPRGITRQTLKRWASKSVPARFSEGIPRGIYERFVGRIPSGTLGVNAEWFLKKFLEKILDKISEKFSKKNPAAIQETYLKKFLNDFRAFPEEYPE